MVEVLLSFVIGSIFGLLFKITIKVPDELLLNSNKGSIKVKNKAKKKTVKKN